MNNFDSVKKMGELYEEILRFRKDDDYEINPAQLDKLVQVTAFFMDAAKQLDGRVEPVRLVPREEHSGVTAEFPVFDIVGEDIHWLCDVMQHCSALTIDPAGEGVCISCTVPDVFIPVQR